MIPLPLIAIEVETSVAKQAIELALELGFNNVELKGNSEILIKVLKSGNRSLAQYGHIVSNIHFLASHFSFFNLSRVHRHCNKVAHSLARRAILSPSLSIWIENVPPNIIHVL